LSAFRFARNIVCLGCLIALFTGPVLAEGPSTLPAIAPKPYRPALADFRIDASEILPEVESAQNTVFSDTISAIPGEVGVEKIVAPPLTVVLHQQIGVCDVASGQCILNGNPSRGFELIGTLSSSWEPGQWTTSLHGRLLSLSVQQTALNQPAGLVEKIVVKNEWTERRTFRVFSIQQPRIGRPSQWGYGPTFSVDTAAPTAGDAPRDTLLHANSSGAVAIASHGTSHAGYESYDAAVASLTQAATQSGAQQGGHTVSAISWKVELNPGAEATIYAVIEVSPDASQAASSASKVSDAPAVSIQKSRSEMQQNLSTWFEKLPQLTASPAVSRFYYHAAAQLLYDRWKLGTTFVLDPWYPVSGRDSGGMNLYAWDVQYAALTFSFLDPTSLRAIIKALPAAPLTEHYAIEPLHGRGDGAFYTYNPYVFTSTVDQYLRTTGDWSILTEQASGKSILEWLVQLAEWGEKDRDPDGDGLLDYGNDTNLLELHKTGSGSGYINEVPSPNGERVYVYRTVANFLEHVAPQQNQETIRHLRSMADSVSKVVNQILWLDRDGWYGTKQRDGSVIPVYSIQIYELLRVPGLVPRDRAEKMMAHLNDSEFVAQWGIRSMSIKDRLFDYNDHDWAGPMSYTGTGPELSADFFSAGFPAEGWMSLNKILWWPDHLAVYPQGITNDSYAFRNPQTARFGGRAGAGRSNLIASSAGVDAILRGIFGLEMSADGSIKVANNQKVDSEPMAVSIPFRGRVWTVTNSRDGIDLRSSDDFDAEFFRNDGSIRVLATSTRVAISLNSRTAHASRFSVGLGYLIRTLGARSKSDLVFHIDGVAARPNFAGDRAILSTNTRADSEQLIEITAARK
jgi:hypothetical protein